MYNDLFSIGPFTVHMYGLMIAIGIIAAYLLTEHRAKKQGLDADSTLDLVIWCVVSGFLGAKILYWLTIIPQIAEDPAVMWRTLGDGWVVYGGIIGGIIGAFLFCRWKKFDQWKYFDLALPSVALAQGFGRIGCFFAGCCYGEETTSACHIVFQNSSFAPNGVPLVPTQLISSGLDFLLFAFLLFFYKKKKADGQITALYLICYSVGRFILEFFRGDLIRGSVGPLSTSQFIAIFVFLAGVILFILRTKSTPVLEEDSEKDSEAEPEAAVEEAQEKEIKAESDGKTEQTEVERKTEEEKKDSTSEKMAEEANRLFEEAVEADKKEQE